MAYPAAPTVGDLHTELGIQYQWEGTFWRPTNHAALWEVAGDSEMRRTYGPITAAQYSGLSADPGSIYLVVG